MYTLQLHSMLCDLLPVSGGGLVQLIWDLREGIHLPKTQGTAFDLELPPNEAHPQAYPASARTFLSRTFPDPHPDGAHVSRRGKFKLHIGEIGEIPSPITPMVPSRAVHHAGPPILYSYKGSLGQSL